MTKKTAPPAAPQRTIPLDPVAGHFQRARDFYANEALRLASDLRDATAALAKAATPKPDDDTDNG